MKLGFLAFDEQFTQISDQFLETSWSLLRLCNDLGADIMLITHDERISLDDVDTSYLIENGKSIKIK